MREIIEEVEMFNILQKGGFILWIIMGLSIIAIAIIIERLIFFQKILVDEDKLIDRLKSTLAKGHFDEALSICDSNPFAAARRNAASRSRCRSVTFAFLDRHLSPVQSVCASIRRAVIRVPVPVSASDQFFVVRRIDSVAIPDVSVTEPHHGTFPSETINLEHEYADVTHVCTPRAGRRRVAALPLPELEAP